MKVQRKGLCKGAAEKGKKETKSQVSKEGPIRQVPGVIPGDLRMRRKVAPSLHHQLQPWDLFATFELPGPKWRPPDGEIPEANIKVHRGRIRGEAETNQNLFLRTNSAGGWWKILFC